MKVVFLCQRVPYPPDRGDRITTWNFLQHLLDRGARVWLGCFTEEDRDLDGVRFLQQRCHEVVAPRLDRRWRKLTSLRGLLTDEPLTLPFFRHPALQAAVDRWFEQHVPDLVYVYSSSMAQYALAQPAALKIMQFAELDSDKWLQYAARSGPLLRWLYRREGDRLLEFEDSVARSFDESLVVSEVEKELFMARIHGITPVVMPNGVDVAHFRSQGDERREPHTAIFTGVMDYEPNVDGICWFVERCWPELRRRHGDARLLIVGSRPVAKVTALAKAPGVEVTGRVPETPPWFDRAAVAIAPLRLARGVQNKVLEALSMGVPVVATPQAAQGLGAIPDGPVAIADDAAATVAAVARWFDDPAAARAMGEVGAQWVRDHFRWSHMFAKLDTLLRERGLQLPGPA